MWVSKEDIIYFYLYQKLGSNLRNILSSIETVTSQCTPQTKIAAKQQPYMV